jgi:hypothetical protein
VLGSASNLARGFGGHRGSDSLARLWGPHRRWRLSRVVVPPSA